MNDVNERPVHIAFYFDQSSYAIEFGPNSHNLYINPLVITYDYDFDEIQHRGTASFPTVYSERAIRQLEHIRDLLKHGHNVCYMFLSMYSGAKEIILDQQQKEYLQLFCECIEKGMTVCGFSLRMKNGVSSVKTRITVRY